jgi:hypothetical protein
MTAMTAIAVGIAGSDEIAAGIADGGAKRSSAIVEHLPAPASVTRRGKI